MTPLQAAGAAVSTAGVVLIGLSFGGGWRSTRIAGPGIAFALVALVGFAAVTVMMADPIRAIGWLPALAISRAANALLGSVLLAIALAGRPRWAAPLLEIRGSPAGRAAGWSPRTAIVLAGLLDVGGLISFGVGLETSLVWLVGLASSFGPVFAVTVAVLVLGERPRPVQWLGIVGIAAGIILIGMP
jgi:drug/metabolite transporter (DMT)-like permease